MKSKRERSKLAFDEDADHALGGAAQGEGIARSGGDESDAEAAAEGVQFVGQRHDLRGAVARNGVLHAFRLVVIVDGLPDGFGLALHACVEAADHALEFGEFLDQFGGEIDLAEFGGAHGVGISAEFGGELHHAFGLGQVAAEFGLEGDVGEVRFAVGERFSSGRFPRRSGRR